MLPLGSIAKCSVVPGIQPALRIRVRLLVHWKSQALTFLSLPVGMVLLGIFCRPSIHHCLCSAFLQA